MKFYIKVHYTESVRRSFFKKKYILDPISIGIVCENGSELFLVSSEFNSRYLTKEMVEETIKYLPVYRKDICMSNVMIAEKLQEWIWGHANDNASIELVFDDSCGYAALRALVGNSNFIYHLFDDIAHVVINIDQTIRHHLSLMEAHEFENSTDYGEILINNCGVYTMKQKQAMFNTHFLLPKKTEFRTGIDHAKWLYAMGKFVDARIRERQLAILTKIAEIESEK